MPRKLHMVWYRGVTRLCPFFVWGQSVSCNQSVNEYPLRKASPPPPVFPQIFLMLFFPYGEIKRSTQFLARVLLSVVNASHSSDYWQGGLCTMLLYA